MSLFRLREWWHFRAGDDSSECSTGALCMVKLGDKSNQNDLLVVGSLSGLIRVFNIMVNLTGNEESVVSASTLGTYKAEHLLLEKQLDYPILSNEKQHLAVLHPRKLAVYSFGRISAGQVEHGNQYELTLVYEHFLQRTAYNFVDGPFGNVSGRDFCCVQSLDGTLSIFEQENFAFTRFLPGSLLPGPLAYLRRADTFVTVSSQWQVEAYRYQVLAVAADAKSKEDAEKSTTGKRVAMDWSYCLGEMVLSVQAVEISPAPPSVIVLGERTLYCLTEGGQLRFLKKLDYEPSCVFVYGATSEGFLQFVIASHTSTLLFYADTVLKWAAQAPFSPVSIRTASFGMVRSMLICLSDFGSVLCAYLGTDPALYGIPVTDRSNIDYSSKQTELRQLQAVIKTSRNDTNLTRAKGSVEDLKMSFHVPSKPDASLGYDGSDNSGSVTVRIMLSVNQPLENLRIFVMAPPPIVAHAATFAWPSLRSKEEFSVTFSADASFAPAHLQVKFQASYNLLGGGGKTYRTFVQLPLTLVAKPSEVVKSAVHKITFDTNKSPLNLNDLFPEFVPAGSTGPLQAMGFQLQGKAPPVGILASKQSQKYRVQSDTFEQIPMFLNELILRLKRYYASDSGFRLGYNGPLPFAEYFTLIDQHFEIYRKKLKLHDALAQKAAQFRAAERQLLLKLNETVSSQMAHVDALIEMTYRQITSLASSIQDLGDSLKVARSTLTAGTHLFITLIELTHQLGPTERRSLENLFYVDGEEMSEQAWEEQVDAGLVYVLQMMSKSGGAAAPTNMFSLQRLVDNTRLKKHIVLLTEKLAKGAKLPLLGKVQSEENAKTTKATKDAAASKLIATRTLEPISEDTNWKDMAGNRFGEADVPAGAAFGKLAEGHLQPLPTSLPPLSGRSGVDNADGELRPSTDMSRRDEDSADPKSESGPRARSAARARSRSAGKRRTELSAADGSGEATYQVDDGVGQNNNFEKKRTQQRLSTPKEKIESESFNDVDDGANGYF